MMEVMLLHRRWVVRNNAVSNSDPPHNPCWLRWFSDFGSSVVDFMMVYMMSSSHYLYDGFYADAPSLGGGLPCRCYPSLLAPGLVMAF
jgi:hypothetical protein